MRGAAQLGAAAAEEDWAAASGPGAPQAASASAPGSPGASVPRRPRQAAPALSMRDGSWSPALSRVWGRVQSSWRGHRGCPCVSWRGRVRSLAGRAPGLPFLTDSFLQLLWAWRRALGSLWGAECDRLTLPGLHPGTLAPRASHTNTLPPASPRGSGGGVCGGCPQLLGQSLRPLSLPTVSAVLLLVARAG